MTTDRTESLVGEDGKVHRDWFNAEITIKARVAYPGSTVTDLIVGGRPLKIDNRLLKCIVVKAKKPRTVEERSESARRAAATRAATMNPERRTEIARAAAKARWDKLK